MTAAPPIREPGLVVDGWHGEAARPVPGDVCGRCGGALFWRFGDGEAEAGGCAHCGICPCYPHWFVLTS